MKQTIVAASGNNAMLQQRAVWEFQKSHFEWQKKLFAENFQEKSQSEPPTFPDRVLEEDLE